MRGKRTQSSLFRRLSLVLLHGTASLILLEYFYRGGYHDTMSAVERALVDNLLASPPQEEQATRILEEEAVEKVAKKQATLKSNNIPSIDRLCHSPESTVSWPFQGEHQSRVPGSEKTCGLDSRDPFAHYLKTKVVPTLETLSFDCERLVVHGAVFGVEHLNHTLSEKSRKYMDPEGLVQNHGKCFFMYCLEDELQQLVGDEDGNRSPSTPYQKEHTIYIPLSRWMLPYENFRRNVKLFKFSVHLLYPKAQRVIWQDGKFFRPDFKMRAPQNYFDAAYSKDACVSVWSLPVIGNWKTFEYGLEEPSFLNHCEVIYEQYKNGRGDVSDDIRVMMKQCLDYDTMEQDRLASDPSIHDETSVTLHHSMVDTAFMVWNQQSEACRQFNAELSCTVLDEIHCNSDRDQVAWPHALTMLDLKRQEGTVPKDVAFHGRWHDQQLETTDTNNYPKLEGKKAVHIMKSDCHWYYRSLDSCESLSDGKQPSLAVLVSGGLKRFLFNSTAEHLLRPLQTNGHPVDLYASVSRSSGPSYRESMAYMKHVAGDPLLRKGTEFRSQDAMVRIMLDRLLRSSGSIRKMSVSTNPTEIHNITQVVQMRAKAKKEYPDRDPDWRFPTIDDRLNYEEMTANSNRNIMVLFRNQQKMWDRSVVPLENMVGKQYDYVMIMRDDTYWLHDFDLNKLIATNPNADMYVQSCDARDPAWNVLEICDHGMVVKREKAEVLTRYFDSLFHTDLEPCHKLARLKGYSSERGCNSEMILKYIVEHNNMVVQQVPQSLLPFQRSLRVRHANGKEEYCFHKYCQSHDKPMSMPDNLKQCKDLNTQFKEEDAKSGNIATK